MCVNCLRTLYKSFHAEVQSRSTFLEEWLSFTGQLSPLSDERRNEPKIYADLFSDACRRYPEELHRSAMQAMRGQSYASSNDVLMALEFLQEIVVTAMWKYECVVGEPLEAFAREFDRLDIQAERKRLHRRAQQT